MAQISPQLVWAICRNNHAYMMKRDHCKTFSKESFNLKKIHSPKYNGFINEVGMDIVAKDKGITVCQRVQRNYFKPALNYKRRPQNCSDKKAFNNIRKLALNQKCRPDLEMTALSRASTLLRSQHKTSGKVSKRPHLSRVVRWRKADARTKARKAKYTERATKQKARKTARKAKKTAA